MLCHPQVPAITSDLRTVRIACEQVLRVKVGLVRYAMRAVFVQTTQCLWYIHMQCASGSSKLNVAGFALSHKAESLVALVL